MWQKTFILRKKFWNSALCYPSGAYGIVYRARDTSGRYVALKKIRISLTSEGIPMTTLREISLLKNLDSYSHPHIVKLVAPEIVTRTFSNFGKKTFRCHSPTRWSWKPAGTIFGFRILGKRPGRLHFASAHYVYYPFASDSGKKMFVRRENSVKYNFTVAMFFVSFRRKQWNFFFFGCFRDSQKNFSLESTFCTLIESSTEI